MKPVFYTVSLLAAILLMSFNIPNTSNLKKDISMENSKAQDSVLRHVVLFKFKPNTAKEDIEISSTSRPQGFWSGIDSPFGGCYRGGLLDQIILDRRLTKKHKS